MTARENWFAAAAVVASLMAAGSAWIASDYKKLAADYKALASDSMDIVKKQKALIELQRRSAGLLSTECRR